MVQKIVIFILLAVVAVPSWQIGTLMLQKKKTSYVIQEQANKIKKYDNEDIVKKNLVKELELLNLPTKFSFQTLERRKVKITYNYKGVATIFGYTYYTADETFEAVTED